MFSTKTSVVLAFVLATVVVINGLNICPEVCTFEYRPLCVTLRDGTAQEFANVCTFTIESCKRNIGIQDVNDIEEGACPDAAS